MQMPNMELATTCKATGTVNRNKANSPPIWSLLYTKTYNELSNKPNDSPDSPANSAMLPCRVTVAGHLVTSRYTPNGFIISSMTGADSHAANARVEASEIKIPGSPRKPPNMTRATVRGTERREADSVVEAGPVKSAAGSGDLASVDAGLLILQIKQMTAY